MRAAPGPQLELFHGPHLPLMRCLAALEAGDVGAAHEALATGRVAAADRARLAVLLAGLPPLPGAPSGGMASGSLAGGAVAGIRPGGTPRAPEGAEAVHAAFEAALAVEPAVAGEIPAAIWFRLYARRAAAALADTPGRQLRGWCAVHFDLAAGDAAAALARAKRLVATSEDGGIWREAARAAWAAGEGGLAARWLMVACLQGEAGGDPDPPRIAAAGAPALEPPPGALPRFPPDVEDLWGQAEALELPGPAAAWIPAVGVVEGVFSSSLLGWSVDLAGSGFDPASPAPAEEPAPRAFLRALLDAWRARAASPPGRGPGPAELAARRQMSALAPRLLARYLARLGGPTGRGRPNP